MNYREAAIYANISKIEVKTEFGDILEAMEAIGHSKSISIDMMDFWLNGATLANYEIYLRSLDAEKLLSDNGIPKMFIKDVLQSDAIDRLAHSDTNQLLIIPYSNLTIEKSIKASAKF